ncbi:5456_t:CDS:2, partial [Dentiscutata erythropus]
NCSRKSKAMQKLDKNDEISRMSSTNDINIDLCVPQNIILQIHDPKSDEYAAGQLKEVLSYTNLGIALQKYWFYSPKCAQLASDIFNVPVIVLTAESYSFISLNQEPGFCKRPIILQWHDSHIKLIEHKNWYTQPLSLNP